LFLLEGGGGGSRFKGFAERVPLPIYIKKKKKGRRRGENFQLIEITPYEFQSIPFLSGKEEKFFFWKKRGGKNLREKKDQPTKNIPPNCTRKDSHYQERGGKKKGTLVSAGLGGLI